jgi:hypothetical protein
MKELGEREGEKERERKGGAKTKQTKKPLS